MAARPWIGFVFWSNGFILSRTKVICFFVRLACYFFFYLNAQLRAKWKKKGISHFSSLVTWNSDWILLACQRLSRSIFIPYILILAFKSNPRPGEENSINFTRFFPHVQFCGVESLTGISMSLLYWNSLVLSWLCLSFFLSIYFSRVSLTENNESFIFWGLWKKNPILLELLAFWSKQKKSFEWQQARSLWCDQD